MRSSLEPRMVVATVLLSSLTIWSAGPATAAAAPVDAGRKSLAGISTKDFSYVRRPSYGTPVELPPCHQVARHTAGNAGTKRTDASGLARRNSSAIPWGHGKLKFAVPKKDDGFEHFVGFSIDLFKNAMNKLQNPRRYELCVFNGTYDELVRNVSLGVFDGAVGDVTITADRVNLAGFTMPYAQSALSLLTLTDNDSKPSIQWIFLEPLTMEMWLTTVGFFLFIGFVVWMIERPINTEYQGSILRQFITAAYFAFSTLTFSHGQAIRSPLTKVVLVIWCFAVLVIVQSYTANLASMLTTKKLQPSVTDLDQLLRNGDYIIGYQNGAFVRSMLIKRGASVDRLKPYNNQNDYDEALRKGSKNGGVSAIVDETPYLSFFQHNKEYMMVDILYMTPGLGFVFPNWTSPLVHDVSLAILNITEGKDGSQIREKWFGRATGDTIDESAHSSAPFTLRSFSGLFVITGCVSFSMLFISIITRSFCGEKTRARGSESQSADGHGCNVCLGGPSALHNDIGNSSVPDHRHHEDSNSGGANGDGGSTCEEAGPMHHVMSNGHVPEVSVHIEMGDTSQGVGRVL